LKFKRALLKLSGESLANSSGFGVDADNCLKVAKMIKKCVDQGLELAIVIGAGNFWRGRTGTQISRVKSDKMGILATGMNALAFSDVLSKQGMKCCIQSSLEVKGILPSFSVCDSVNALEEKKIVLFSCGTGSPFFSTDTAAALRAAEINADIILKATTIDGVYSSDPKVDKNASKYDKVSFDEVLQKKLNIMDMTAISLCRDIPIPVLVFNFEDIEKAILGENVGTLIFT